MSAPITEHLDRRRQWAERCPLRHYRDGHGLSQADFAEQLGVGPSSVYQWEAGSRSPSLENWIQIADLTGLSLAEWVAWWNDRLNRD